jgi:hypothetical protein
VSRRRQRREVRDAQRLFRRLDVEGVAALAEASPPAGPHSRRLFGALAAQICWRKREWGRAQDLAALGEQTLREAVVADMRGDRRTAAELAVCAQIWAGGARAARARALGGEAAAA